jgi:hypothetical protein
MNLPTKPQVCVIDGRLAVFMGTDYKFLELEVAERFCRLVQSQTDKLRREHRRALRAAAKRAGV